MTGKKAILLILIIGFYVLFMIFGGILGSSYKLFNTYDIDEVYGYGTYEDAIRIVDDCLSNPDFEWAGEYQGHVKDIWFSMFNLTVNDVHMKLTFWDYIKYKNYISKKYKEFKKTVKPNLVTDTPWRDL